MVLSVPNLDEKVEKISEDLYKNKKQVFDNLVKTYYEYKNILFFIKEFMIIKQLSLQNNDFREIINFNKLSFSEIRKKKEFKILLKEENKINHNFHGNSDLFNLIKGFTSEVGRLSTSDQIDVTDIIEKYI